MSQLEYPLEGKRILVTGGTGSMGKVLVRRILSGELGTPAKVIVLSRDEAKHYQMRMNYLNRRVTTDEVIYRNFLETLEFRLGDVRRFDDVLAAARSADVVINAAALKQVPNCEYFPEQALLTNCIGPSNIVRAIHDHQLPVQTVLGISTDKACKPINVMGLTKALHERIFTSANVLNPATRFICVRYGNVLASRGSVVPLFHDQIRHGGPVTVTDAAMTRFLMSLDDAVDCVFAALRMAHPGETFVPRAPAANMLHLAQALIGDRDLPIKVTGIRPGEKMHEIMVSDEECPYAEERQGYFAIGATLPELKRSHAANLDAAARPLTAAFSSADQVLSLPETVELLRSNGLLVEQSDPSSAVELSEQGKAA